MLSRPASLASAAAVVLAAISSVAAQLPPIDPTTADCYSSNIGGITYLNSSMTYNSHGGCVTMCGNHNAAVVAVNNFNCWCGKLLPKASDKLPASECQLHCPGFPSDACGNSSPYLFSVGVIGDAQPGSVGEGSDSSSTGSTGSSTSKPHTTQKPVHIRPTTVRSIVIIGSTVFQTVSGPATSQPEQSTSSSSSGGTNKAGIAAGIVVGIVALGAIVGGVYLYLRQRRHKALEKAHRRQTSINAFAASQAKGPHMSALPMNDSRLDPVIAARRQSDGSIADNQDFSRRVLKVTNPDDRW